MITLMVCFMIRTETSMPTWVVSTVLLVAAVLPVVGLGIIFRPYFEQKFGGREDSWRAKAPAEELEVGTPQDAAPTWVPYKSPQRAGEIADVSSADRATVGSLETRDEPSLLPPAEKAGGRQY